LIFESEDSRTARDESGVGCIVVADTDETVFLMARQLTAPDRWEIAYAADSGELLRTLIVKRVKLAIVSLEILNESPLVAEELIARTRRGLRLVVTSEEHCEVNERRARMVGPVYYAPKPVNIGVLGDVIDSALVAAG
jgi:hypothetical protein